MRKLVNYIVCDWPTAGLPHGLSWSATSLLDILHKFPLHTLVCECVCVQASLQNFVILLIKANRVQQGRCRALTLAHNSFLATAHSAKRGRLQVIQWGVTERNSQIKASHTCLLQETAKKPVSPVQQHAFLLYVIMKQKQWKPHGNQVNI